MIILIPVFCFSCCKASSREKSDHNKRVPPGHHHALLPKAPVAKIVPPDPLVVSLQRVAWHGHLRLPELGLRQGRWVLLALEEKTTPLPCAIPALHPRPVGRDQMLQRIQGIPLTQAGSIFRTPTGTRPLACRLVPQATPCHPLDQVIKQSGRINKSQLDFLIIIIANNPPTYNTRRPHHYVIQLRRLETIDRYALSLLACLHGNELDMVVWSQWLNSNAWQLNLTCIYWP